MFPRLRVSVPLEGDPHLLLALGATAFDFSDVHGASSIGVVGNAQTFPRQ
jgi:hypothetical protein